MSHFASTTSVEHCALRATSATLDVLLDDPLLGVDQNERHVGPLGRLERAQLGVVLDSLPVLALAPQPGGVDQQELLLAAHEHRVDRVAGRARAISETITRSLAEERR